MVHDTLRPSPDSCCFRPHLPPPDGLSGSVCEQSFRIHVKRDSQFNDSLPTGNEQSADQVAVRIIEFAVKIPAGIAPAYDQSGDFLVRGNHSGLDPLLYAHGEIAAFPKLISKLIIHLHTGSFDQAEDNPPISEQSTVHWMDIADPDFNPHREICTCLLVIPARQASPTSQTKPLCGSSNQQHLIKPAQARFMISTRKQRQDRVVLITGYQ